MNCYWSLVLCLFKLINNLFTAYSHYIYKTSDYDSFKCHPKLIKGSCMSLFGRLIFKSKVLISYVKNGFIVFTLRKPLALENVNLQKVGFLKAKSAWMGQAAYWHYAN